MNPHLTPSASSAGPSLPKNIKEELDGSGAPSHSAVSPKKVGVSRASGEVNERSLVMKLSFGRRSFLLPGDITEISETRLVGSRFDLKSDVLFVPHHGGSRSSTIPFLEMVKPQIAIISCGFDNVFRLPHPETLRRLDHLQSRIYRTDRDGAVTVTTDGNELLSNVFRSGNS